MYREKKSEFVLRDLKDVVIKCAMFFSPERKPIVDKESKRIVLDKSIELQSQLIMEECTRQLESLEDMGFKPFQRVFNAKIFNLLPEAGKIDLIKNVFGFLGQSRYFGSASSLKDFVNNAKSYIIKNEVIESLPETVKFELAYERIKYVGCELLEELPFLTKTQKQELIQLAEKEVKAWLPVLSDNLINQYVKEKNRIELHYKIYQRFSGEYSGLGKRYRADSAFEKLKKLLLANSESDLNEWVPALKAAMLEQEKYFQGQGWVTWPHYISTPVQWEGGKKNPDEIISFSHGGGGFNCLENLAEFSKGYLSDLSDQMGIYVTPRKVAERDKFYATGTPPSHLDFSVKWESEIQAKFLVNTVNFSYEAIFPCNYGAFLGRVLLTPYNNFDYLKIILEWVSGFRVSLEIPKSLHPEKSSPSFAEADSKLVAMEVSDGDKEDSDFHISKDPRGVLEQSPSKFGNTIQLTIFPCFTPVPRSEAPGREYSSQLP